MNVYKITLAYDGTNYFGWQEQAKKESVAQRLKDSFVDHFKMPLSLIGASRTDAGVHAIGQVARITTQLSLDPERLKTAWNQVLPPDIHIRSIELVDRSFHPWYGVVEKEYYYHLFAERPLPFVSRFGWYYPYKIDFEKLKKALFYCEGTHDFRSFFTGDPTSDSTIRTISKIEVQYLPRWGVYRISIRAQKFMRYMIRRIVGAAVYVAARPTVPVALVQEILLQKNPHHALAKAPAQGLVLRAIRYCKQGDKRYEFEDKVSLIVPFDTE